MTRTLTREDLQEELRTSISKVLRQEVTDFTLTVQRDLREEFRHFFEEIRCNGYLVAEHREHRLAEPSVNNVNRPRSASERAFSGRPTSPSVSALRKGATDLCLAPTPPEDADDSSSALRISSSAYLTDRLQDKIERRVSKGSSWRIFNRRNSNHSTSSRDSEHENTAKPDAPRPSSAMKNIQPPEQGPPMMFQQGTNPGSTDVPESPKALGSLAEGQGEIAEKQKKMVKLQDWAIHPHSECIDVRQQSKDDSDCTYDSDNAKVLPGTLDEDHDHVIGLPGCNEEAWQHNGHQVRANGDRCNRIQRGMTCDRMQKIASARERALYDARDSLHSTETDESAEGHNRITAIPSMLHRDSRESHQSDDVIKSDKPSPKFRAQKTLMQKGKEKFLFKFRSKEAQTCTHTELEEGPVKGRTAHRFPTGRNDNTTMFLRPRVGSITSDNFDAWTGRKKWRCSKWVAFIVASEVFDYFMGIFLVANAISIGIQVDHMASANTKEVPFAFRVVETVFCVVFTLELALRVFVYRTQFFRMKGWQWNMFDSAVVGFQLADEFTKLFLTRTKVRNIIDDLGVLRMLRLGRIVRLIRMVRLIPELKSMVYLISASMWSFFWTVVLLVLVMYCFAVYYTEAATDIGTEDDISDLNRTAIQEHWGSVSRSVFSLYKAITGGDDWVNFVVVFDNPQSNYTLNGLVFCLYMAFAVMVMLNLVTGVFVEGAQRIIREDKDSELIKQVRKLFQLADSDGSNEITWEEFKAQMENRAMDEYFKAVDLSRKEAKDLFKLLDIDHSGSISVEEFVKGCLRLRGPARSVDLAALVYDINMKHTTVKNHMGFIEKKLEMITDATHRTSTFLDTCATQAACDLGYEVAADGMNEIDGILV